MVAVELATPLNKIKVRIFITLIWVGILSSTVYSQIFSKKFKNFENIDSIIFMPNEEGVVYIDSINSEIGALKVGDEFYFFSESLFYSDSIKKLVEVLEFIKQKKNILNISQINNYLIVENLYGYTIISLTDLSTHGYKPKYNKSSLFKDNKGKYLYLDDRYPIRKKFKDKLIVNALPYYKNWRSYLDSSTNNGNSAEALLIDVVEEKIKIVNEYGRRSPKNITRLCVGYQLTSDIEIDKIKDRIFVSSWSEPEIQVFSPDGNQLFEFGESGKYVFYDSIILFPTNKKLYSERKNNNSYNSVAQYRNCVFNQKDNFLIRSYVEGRKMNFNPDSLEALPSINSKGCSVDLYLNEVNKLSPKSNTGIQFYDLNQNPPILIDDVLCPVDFKYINRLYVDNSGHYVTDFFNYATGILKKVRYKLILE